MLLAGASVLGLLAAEMTVRLVRPQAALQVSDSLYEMASGGRFRLRPGFAGTVTNRVEYRTSASVNSLGLRGPEVAAGGGLRVLAIGDSFTFGIGVEDDETWVVRLAAELTATGRPATSFNGGVPGYGVGDAVDWLERYGTALDPGLVVVGVCLANDLQDAAPSREAVQVAYGSAHRGGARPGLGEWLYYNSHLFVFLKNALPAGPYRDLRAAVGLGEPAVVRNLRRQLAIYEVPAGAEVTAGATAMAAAARRLDAWGAAHGARVAALLIPAAIQIDADRWRRAVEQLGPGETELDRGAPTRLVGERFAAADVPTLDLTPALEAARADGEVDYFPIDRHWTPTGHRRAAEALAKWLRDEDLLPAPSGAGEAPS
jgi:lysophospholipase L1-like esterase